MAYEHVFLQAKGSYGTQMLQVDHWDFFFFNETGL